MVVGGEEGGGGGRGSLTKKVYLWICFVERWFGFWFKQNCWHSSGDFSDDHHPLSALRTNTCTCFIV